jgi:hypothetical protein
MTRELRLLYSLKGFKAHITGLCSQPWILASERSGLLTRIAATSVRDFFA